MSIVRPLLFQTFHSWSKAGSRKQNDFSFQVSVFYLGKKAFSKVPCTFSSISLEDTGSQGSLRSLAEGNGVSNVWVGHLVSPNKIRAFLGREKWGMDGCWNATNACHMLCNPKLFVSLYKGCTLETYPVSALCLSKWKFSPVTLLNKLCGLLNWVKTS